MGVFYGHAFVMSLGIATHAAGVCVALFLRQKRWWLKLHRAAGTFGAVCLFAGFVLAFIMVSEFGGGHIKIPHAWLGLATVTIGAVTPILGYLQFQIPSKIQIIRLWHRRLGYATVILGFLSLLSGLAVAGVI